MRKAAASATMFLALWYLTSLTTLFLNKYILSTLHANPQTLAMTQMVTTCVMGALKMYGPVLPAVFGSSAVAGGVVGTHSPMARIGSPMSVARTRAFYRDMLVVGVMRFSTVMLGLISLHYVPVSFTETVKSSAPFFTVLFAWLILGENTTGYVKLSLVPIAGGLAMASLTEASFNTIGFTAALLNNCVDCIQNVFSKKLLSGRYNYISLQFYTSAAALVVQVPVWLVWYRGAIFAAVAQLWSRAPPIAAEDVDDGSGVAVRLLCVAMLVDAVSYHLQSVFAYALMGLISPVTHSVANTVKRALLIWLSVLFFGNAVTLLSVLGSTLVVGGVLMYNWAVHHAADAAGTSAGAAGTAVAVVCDEATRFKPVRDAEAATQSPQLLLHERRSTLRIAADEPAA